MMNTSFSKFQFFLKVQIESLITVLSVVFLEGRDSSSFNRVSNCVLVFKQR